MLPGFGLSADDAFESLKMIGDIAAVSGGSIQGIGIAFGQAAAEGQLMTRDIRQLVNQGVPALKLLADSMGVARDQIFDLASQGQISFQDLQESFKKATEAGGMFADGTKKQAETLAGLYSTLKDNVRIALAGLGDETAATFDLSGLAKSVTNQVQNILTGFEALSDGAKTSLLTIAGLLAAAGPVIGGLGLLSSALAAITWPVAAGAAIVAGLTAIGFNAFKAYSETKQLEETLNNLGDASLRAMVSSIDTIRGEIENIKEVAEELSFSEGTQQWATEKITKYRSELEKISTTATDKLVEGIDNITAAQRRVVQKTIEAGELGKAKDYLDTIVEGAE